MSVTCLDRSRWLGAAALLLVVAACGGKDQASSPAPTSGTCTGGASDPACGSCGDGVVQPARGETCDTALTSGSGACPTSCASSGDACRPSVLQHAGTCTAACVATPITACAPGDGCCPDTCTAAAGDTDCAAPGLDTSGTWYTKLSAPGTIQAGTSQSPVTDDVTLNAWLRTRISSTGEVTFDFCKLTVTGGTKLAPTYSQALLNTLHMTAQLTGGTRVGVGEAITMPAILIHSGRKADGTAVDAVPPPYPAGDGDGKPGVTIPVTVLGGLAPISIDVYAGLEVKGSMTGVSLSSATTMTGSMTFVTDGVVFGSSNTALVGTSSTMNVTTRNGAVPFTSTKLAAGGADDCAHIAGL